MGEPDNPLDGPDEAFDDPDNTPHEDETSQDLRAEVDDYLRKLTADAGFLVSGPAGNQYTVLTAEEVTAFNDLVARYTQDLHFGNVSDLQDLDRIIMLELLCWRWGNWLARDRDYNNDPVDVPTVQNAVLHASRELRLLKKALGIDKVTRDRERGSSVADYWANLLRRAKEFQYHRNEQFTMAITLLQELRAKITLYRNTLEEERAELGCDLHDILRWLEEEAFPKFQEIDDAFQRDAQRFWIRQL